MGKETYKGEGSFENLVALCKNYEFNSMWDEIPLESYKQKRDMITFMLKESITFVAYWKIDLKLARVGAEDPIRDEWG